MKSETTKILPRGETTVKAVMNINARINAYRTEIMESLWQFNDNIHGLPTDVLEAISGDIQRETVAVDAIANAIQAIEAEIGATYRALIHSQHQVNEILNERTKGIQELEESIREDYFMREKIKEELNRRVAFMEEVKSNCHSGVEECVTMLKQIEESLASKLNMLDRM